MTKSITYHVLASFALQLQI